jgi:hypothetical protein
VHARPFVLRPAPPRWRLRMRAADATPICGREATKDPDGTHALAGVQLAALVSSRPSNFYSRVGPKEPPPGLVPSP